MPNHPLFARKLLGLMIWPGLAGDPQVSGEILRIDATITTEVQEFVSGQEGSFDSAFEEFGATSTTLPIHVAAQLLPPEDAATNTFMAAAFADFRDPTLARVRNPGEFGLETEAYSRGPGISFATHAVAVETRKVVFHPDDLGLLEGENEQTAVSGVFVSGAAIIWSRERTRDLTGLSVNLEITIEQQRSEGDPVTVLQAALTARGGPDDTIELHSPDGISALVGGPELIQATADITELELLQELAALGSVHLVLIPPQELPYRYHVSPEIEFDLKATFEARTTNLPDGTGIGAVFGRSFKALAQTIEASVHAAVPGVVTQAAVNETLANAKVPDGTGPRGVALRSSGIPCGALDGGAFALATAFLLSVGVRRLASR